MPLLPDGKHLCEVCLTERSILDTDWVFSANDESTFTSPPCPTCGAVEGFIWHDDIYLTEKREEREVPGELPESPPRNATVLWVEPDPTSFEAEHMTLIEEKAKKLSRKQAKRNIHGPKVKYSTKPKKPTKERVLKEAEISGRPLRVEAPIIRTKDVAEREFDDLKSQIKKDQEAALESIEATVANKTKLLTVDDLPKLVVPKTTQSKMSKPEVDEKPVFVNNAPEGENAGAYHNKRLAGQRKAKSRRGKK